MHRIAIIGGGVIGLSIGWQLARENIGVCIWEAKSAGKQASWAAAGMLAPYSEASYTHPKKLMMEIESLALFPRFLEELADDCGYSLPKECKGTLYAAIDSDDRKWLEREYYFKSALEIPAYRVTGNEARNKEPLLSPRVNSAIWIPSEEQIDNHLLIQALKEAFISRKGVIREHCAVKAVSNGNPISFLTVDDQWHQAEVIINTTGAWSDQLFPQDFTKNVSIRPIKGQIVHLNMKTGLRLNTMIRTPRVYLAPKQDGVVRLGATSEDVGFNEEITAGSLKELLHNAQEVVPAIAEYAFQTSLAGFRPVSNNNMPWIGSTAIPGSYQAIGHGRSGILLAPYTAYQIKKDILCRFNSMVKT